LKHTNNYTISSPRKLLIVGILFVPLAYSFDCLIDSLIFRERSFVEQLINPNYHEIIFRSVFSTFVLGLALYGCHLLKISGAKQESLNQTIENLQKTNQDLEAINHAMTLDIRSMVTSVKVKINLIFELKGKMDEKTLFNTLNSVDHTLMQAEGILDDLHHITKR